MTKDESVSAGLAAIQAAQNDALGKCYDDGAASVQVGGGLSQADIDAAVAQAKAQDAEMLSAAMGEAQVTIDGLNAHIVEVEAKEASESAIVLGLKAKAEEFQAALDKIKALLG